MPNDPSAPRRAVQFIFRGEIVALDAFAPRLTLLDWLREAMLARGTKEGCGEGDCGACTVALARLRDGALAVDAVNACILPLGMVDGAELIVVEDLAEGGALHPVQQAMVDLHASQCGFCTPGFVMSLFSLHHAGAPATHASVCEKLAGNLCRCTGYRPIIDAALATCTGTADDRFSRDAEARRARLAALADARDLFVGDDARFFAAPASEASLVMLMSRFPDATLVAGATDVGLWITKQLRPIERLIWLGRVAGLAAIEDRGAEVRLLAAASLADCLAPLEALHPDLGSLMRRFGSAQVRASGTIGGNIANGSPIGDLAPALIALDATLELAKGGATRTMPLESFFVAYGKQDRAPGEYVRAVAAPKLRVDEAFRALKVTKRFDEDISAVMMAVKLRLDGRAIASGRIAYGGMAATPKRAALAEEALVGASLDDEATWSAALAAIARDFTPLTDQRATAAYRAAVARNVLRKALVEIAGSAAPTRIAELVDAV